MADKRKKKEKTLSIEDFYRNKNFVPPKEKNLETIFEEPRESKDGHPVLTSTRKFRRYLHFDTTVGKIHKRKIKAKKCVKKLNMNRLKTRSSPKVEKPVDISSYISEAMGDSSEEEIETTAEVTLTSDANRVTNSDLPGPKSDSSTFSQTEGLSSVEEEKCVQNDSKVSHQSETISEDICDSSPDPINSNAENSVKSPRNNSCLVS